MKRIFAFLVAALAATGIAFAQKAETPKAAAPATPAKTEAKKDAAPAKADAKKAELMDINSASEKDLATLKGIGEARSKAIVKGRPYKGKDELVQKKILTQSVYDGIKDQIIAKQDTAMKAEPMKAEPKKAEPKKK
jgi:DNA uptake protein ComE-like DNA-binding protein